MGDEDFPCIVPAAARFREKRAQDDKKNPARWQAARKLFQRIRW
jgi:hypothetical protein